MGEFKDDQFQGHEHSYIKPFQGNLMSNINGTNNGAITDITPSIVSDGTHGTPRIGNTTHGKQIGVTYFIKAL